MNSNYIIISKVEQRFAIKLPTIAAPVPGK